MYAPLARVDGEAAAERVDPGPEGDGPRPGGRERAVLAAAPERESPAVVRHHDAHAVVPRLGAHVDTLRAAVAGRVDHGLMHDELDRPGELPGQPLESRVGLEADLQPPLPLDPTAQLLEPPPERGRRRVGARGSRLEIPQERAEVALLGGEEALDVAQALDGGCLVG